MRSVAGLYALAGVALASCGSSALLRKDDPPVAIELRGNTSIETESLIAGLAVAGATRAAGIDPYQLSLDAERLRGAYQRLGYFDVDVTARVESHGGVAAAVFTIVEGPRAPLARIELSGAPDDAALPPASLRARIELADGDPFDYDAYQRGKAAVLAALQDAGYARAALDAQVIADRAHRLAVIRIAIAAGPRCRFGAITLKGVDGPLAEAARARLAIHAGDPYSSHALAESRDALHELRRFASVRIDPDDGAADDAVVPVTIAVSLAQRHEARAGVGVGADPLRYLARARGGYSVAGWPWTMTDVAFEVSPAVAVDHDLSKPEPRVEASGSLTALDFLRPRMTGDVTGTLQFVKIEAFASIGPRVRAGLSTPLGAPWLQLGVGASARRLSVVDIDERIDDAARARLDIAGGRVERVLALDQRVTIDLRDRPLDPHRGALASLRAVEGVDPGAHQRFLELAPDLRGYLPLGPLVIAAHARGGAFLGDVPPTERYVAGGASSQRGFPERALAPVENGVVVGGAALLETGLEVRAPIARLRSLPIVLAGFADGADVTSTPGALDPWHLHWAVGGGLRLVTPYGPVRVDVGVRVNRTGGDEPLPRDRVAWQLSFGEAF